MPNIIQIISFDDLASMDSPIHNLEGIYINSFLISYNLLIIYLIHEKGFEELIQERKKTNNNQQRTTSNVN